MKIEKVDAICLLVNDLLKSRNFYEGILGLPVAINDQGFVEYRLGETPLAIFERTHAASMFPKSYMRLGGGAVIALRVDDVTKACEELKQKAVTIFEGPKTTPWNQEVAYLYDPDNYIIEITKYDQKE